LINLLSPEIPGLQMPENASSPKRPLPMTGRNTDIRRRGCARLPPRNGIGFELIAGAIQWCRNLRDALATVSISNNQTLAVGRHTVLKGAEEIAVAICLVTTRTPVQG
jgi:hypothetical protein